MIKRRLKWKPPSENSIDFKLELRFPALASDPAQTDLFAKPEFLLHTWLGQRIYEYFDEMEVDDEEWEKSVSSLPVPNHWYTTRGSALTRARFKESGEQLDDRIVEVSWDNGRSAWRMIRIRDDKPNANHKSVMEKIIVSIEDGVEIEAVSEKEASQLPRAT